MKLNSRPKVLVLIDWFEPGYRAGGPIRSVANLVRALEGEVEFWILTSDRDLGQAEAYAEVPLGTWLPRSFGYVQYLPTQAMSWSMLGRTFREQAWQQVYFNSLFSPRFTLLPLVRRQLMHRQQPVLLAPRGMLGRGSLALKAGKKRWFLRLSKALGLFNRVTWHASTTQEAADIRQVFPRAEVRVAPNLAATTRRATPLAFKQAGELRLIMPARIARVKNTHVALDLMRQLPAGARYHFSLCGAIDELDYWEICQQLIAQCPEHVQVTHLGPLPFPAVGPALEQHHALLFPTTHENFGHAIAEALFRGLPAIVSDRTPWRDLEPAQAGWDLPLENHARWLALLPRLAAMDGESWKSWSENAVKFATEHANTPEVKAANQQLFQR